MLKLNYKESNELLHANNIDSNIELIHDDYKAGTSMSDIEIKANYLFETDYVSTNVDAIIKHINRKKELVNNYRPLSKIALDKVRTDLTIKEIYHSNAIEGNRLTERETYMALRENSIVKNSNVTDINEAFNMQSSLRYTGTLLYKRLNIDDIMHIQELITQNTVDYNSCGILRNGEVMITNSRHKPPRHAKVRNMLEIALNEYYTGLNGCNNLIAIFKFHHIFTNIHPFFDGNGRTGRIIMSLMLLQQGYISMVINKDTKYEYYEALEYVDIYYDYRKLFNFCLRRLNDTYNIYLNNIGIN